MPCPVGIDILRAAGILQDGGLVAFPTETVYGLGANALNAKSVARIFAAKDRPYFDPIIVHVAERSALDQLVRNVPRLADQLAARFWPGPLTLVLPKSDIVPDIVTAGLSTVAIRVPDHPVALALLRESGLPIAAPSANPFGRISPTRSEHVLEMLGEKIDYILDGGPCRVGVESTVLDLSGDAPMLLRPGGLPVEEITAVIGPVKIPEHKTDSDSTALPSPGMLPRHYAPRTPLVILAPGESHNVSARAGRGLLTFKPSKELEGYGAVEVLSSSGDLAEAAANFFAALRRLDSSGLEQIDAQEFPDHGLGRALNDRLRRASQSE